jgi:hypothetical protein
MATPKPEHVTDEASYLWDILVILERMETLLEGMANDLATIADMRED